MPKTTLSPKMTNLNQTITRRFLEDLSNQANDALTFSGVGGTGIVVARTTSTAVARTITGVNNRTTITNGSGVSGNPVVDIASTYVGQTSITTLGTVTTGDVSQADIKLNYTGTVARDLRDKLAEIVSIKDFGAVGDGSTDDTAAIQAALDASGSINSTGVVLFFPPGRYRVSSTLTIPTTAGQGLHLQGASKSCTAILRTNAFTSGDLFYAGTISGFLVSFLTISDMTIGNEVSQSSGAAIHLDNRKGVEIYNLLIFDEYRGIWLDGDVTYTNIHDVRYVQSSTTALKYSGIEYSGGIQAQNFLHNVSVQASNATSSSNCLTYGILIQTADGLQISNCASVATYDIYIEAGQGYNVDDIYCSNCIFDQGRNHALVMTGVARTQSKFYSSIRFIGCHFSPNSTHISGTYGVFIDGDCDYVQFIGCNMTITGSSGIYLGQPSVNFQNVATRSIQIQGCLIGWNDNDNTGKGAIYLDSGQSGVSIVGNNIQNWINSHISEYAISLIGSNSNITIANNNLLNQDTAAIYYGAAKTSYTNLLIYGNQGEPDRFGDVDFGRFAFIYDANGNKSIGIGAASSAVNYLNVVNSATGIGVTVIPAGTDSNISLVINPKGDNTVRIGTGDSSNQFVDLFDNVSSARARLVTSTISSSTIRSFTFPDSSGTFYVTGGTDVAVADGGTNLSSYTQGDLLYASGATTLSKLAKDTNATRYLSNTGSSNNPAWAQIDLTNGVTGILPQANGGWGQPKGYSTTATAAGTTTLTVSSNVIQDFTGATTQTVVLPVTSTLQTGFEYRIYNHSSGNVTVQSSGTNTLSVLTNLQVLKAICISTSGTGTASWSWSVETLLG